MQKPSSDSNDNLRDKRSVARPRWHARNVALLCAVVGLSAACAGGRGHAGAAPSAHGQATLEAYDTVETSRPVLGAGEDEASRAEFARALQEVARDAGLELRGDGRLARLAQQLASDSAADSALDMKTLAAHARVFGVPEVAIEQRSVRSADRASLARAAATALSDTLRASHATHFGAFIADDGRSASVVLTRRPFTFAPVARRVPVGSSLALRGRLAASYRDLELVVSGPSGVSTLPAGEGSEFELRLPMRVAGDYRLSLQATAAEQKQTIAALVVSVGDVKPAPRSADTTSSSAQLVQALYAHSTALRTERGVAPLQVDRGLELRAEHESAALAAGAAPDVLLTRQGLPLRAIARGRDERALWEDFVRDPAGARAVAERGAHASRDRRGADRGRLRRGRRAGAARQGRRG